eukprot:symbB.v1.2.003885.t1/scaffold211.1/size373615/26
MHPVSSCDLESDVGKTMTSLRRPDALSYHIAMLMLQRVQRNKDAETLYKEVIRDRLCPPWILGKFSITVEGLDDDLADIACRIFFEEVIGAKTPRDLVIVTMAESLTDRPKDKARKQALAKISKEYGFEPSLKDAGELRISRFELKRVKGLTQLRTKRMNREAMAETLCWKACNLKDDSGDILDKMNPDLMLMKDQQQRLHETLNQVITRVPALAVGDAQVREECSIFRNDIGKLSQEIVQMGESLQHMMPWVDWLHDHQPAISCLEDRLAALEHARGEQLEINSEDLQVLVHRLSNCEKDQQDEHRCITELQSSCRKLTEAPGMRKVLGLEVLQRKSIINNEEFKSWRQDFDAMKVRVKRFEMNQLQEQKNLKTCQDNCSRYRKACEDIYAKYHQEMSQKQSSGNQQHEAYAKWREDAVAWQQEQMRKFQSQK